MARKKLIRQNAKRVLVRAPVLRLVLALLRSHIRRRTAAPLLGHRLCGRLLDPGGNAKVDQPRDLLLPALHKENILRLHIAVNDAHFVSVIQRLGNRTKNLRDL